MTSLETTLTQYILPIGGAFLLAYLVHRLAGRVAGRFVRLSDYVPQSTPVRLERQRTLHGLLSSMITFAAVVVAIIFSLGRFVDANTLVWMIGLFSAAFGLGARPLISDWLTGIGFIFEDTFDIGEKIEIQGVEGVIEKINLRTTHVRAPSGELFIIPNGEIRVIRNFSRGRFSTTNISLRVHAADLEGALTALDALAVDAVVELPNLIEPWQVINTTGMAGGTIELTLLAKARFGKAAEMRPRLLALVQKRLAEAEIVLLD